MAAVVAGVAASVSWCFCTAFTSLLGSCCGNDKASTIAAGPSSGRKRSVCLLFISICICLGFQYGLAPYFVKSSTLSMVTTYFQDAWLDGCQEYSSNKTLLERCATNNGNFRVSAATTLFFVLAGIAVTCRQSANREAWPAKFVLYLFLVAATAVIPGDPIFSKVYLIVARVGGVFFVLFQQVLLLDAAYNWNDSWVEKSNKAETEEGMGAGKKWLLAIVASCVILFGATLIGIIFMGVYYTGCTENNVFIWTTVVLSILLTFIQLSGEQGSLLGSACVCVWAAFLCFSAVTKNPNANCNPNAGETNWLSVAFGLVVTLFSLCWAGWSWTAESTFGDTNEINNTNSAEPALYNSHNGTSSRNEIRENISGIVVGSVSEDESKPVETKSKSSSAWKINAALATVSCWTSMVLTDWGAIQGDGSIANSATGRIAMWMLMASQWFVLILYMWTLSAPRLFPDRDFS